MVKLISKKLLGAKTRAIAMFAILALVVAAIPAAAAPVDFTGTTLPFTVPDMLTTAVNFLTLYGAWILLALGVIFSPVLYGLAMKLVAAAKKRTSS